MSLRCPVDGLLLVERTIDERPMASCAQCHGLFVSGRAIAETQLPSEQVSEASRRSAAAMSPAPHARRCPQCGQVMRSEQHAGITFERCPGCHASWLDAGEFDVVREALVPNASRAEADKAKQKPTWLAWDVLAEAMMILPALLDG